MEGSTEVTYSKPISILPGQPFYESANEISYGYVDGSRRYTRIKLRSGKEAKFLTAAGPKNEFESSGLTIAMETRVESNNGFSPMSATYKCVGYPEWGGVILGGFEDPLIIPIPNKEIINNAALHPFALTWKTETQSINLGPNCIHANLTEIIFSDKNSKGDTDPKPMRVINPNGIEGRINGYIFIRGFDSTNTTFSGITAVEFDVFGKILNVRGNGITYTEDNIGTRTLANPKNFIIDTRNREGEIYISNAQPHIS